MTEKQLLEAVRDCARLLGWLTYHTHRSDRSEPGFPDLVLVKAPRIIFAELKTEKGKTTDAQERWLAALGAGPWRSVYVWRPEDWTSGRIEAALRGAGG